MYFDLCVCVRARVCVRTRKRISVNLCEQTCFVCVRVRACVYARASAFRSICANKLVLCLHMHEHERAFVRDYVYLCVSLWVCLDRATMCLEQFPHSFETAAETDGEGVG